MLSLPDLTRYPRLKKIVSGSIATYCQPNACFAAQAEPLAGRHTLEQYAEWMRGLLVFVPDGSYAVKSFATDPERNDVCAYAVFSGTHSADGGPMPRPARAPAATTSA